MLQIPCKSAKVSIYCTGVENIPRLKTRRFCRIDSRLYSQRRAAFGEIRRCEELDSICGKLRVEIRLLYVYFFQTGCPKGGMSFIAERDGI